MNVLNTSEDGHQRADMETSDRRAFLSKTLGVTAGLVGAAVAGAYAAPASAQGSKLRAVQEKWRFCANCYGMFFWGYPDHGRCPVGGSHSAAGYNFVLPVYRR